MSRVTAKLAPSSEPDVVLQLPADVARSLYAMTCRVSGDRQTSYRKDADAIRIALEDSGCNLSGCANGSRFREALDAQPRPVDGT